MKGVTVKAQTFAYAQPGQRLHWTTQIYPGMRARVFFAEDYLDNYAGLETRTTLQGFAKDGFVVAQLDEGLLDPRLPWYLQQELEPRTVVFKLAEFGVRKPGKPLEQPPRGHLMAISSPAWINQRYVRRLPRRAHVSIQYKLPSYGGDYHRTVSMNSRMYAVLFLSPRRGSLYEQYRGQIASKIAKQNRLARNYRQMSRYVLNNWDNISWGDAWRAS